MQSVTIDQRSGVDIRDSAANRFKLVRLPWALFVAVIFFSVAGLYQIELPGLYGDEALQAAPAARIANDTLGRTPGAGGLWFLDRSWPLFVMSYIGPVKTYILALSFWIFGTSVPVLRATTLACALVGVVFTYLFLQRLFGRRAASIGVVLIASDVSLILFSRADWGPIAIAFAAKMAGLYGLARWWTDRRDWLAAGLGGLAFGLGMTHKADFNWFILAILPVAVTLLALALRSRNSLHSLLLGLAAGVTGLLCGALPLLLFNVTTGWLTWTGPRQELAASLDRTYPGIPFPNAFINLAFSQAQHRFEVLKTVIDGGNYLGWTTGVFDARIRELHWEIFVLGFALGSVALLATSLAKRSMRLGFAAFAFTLIPVIVFMEILVTPAATGGHHSISVYPFPHMIMALGFAALFSIRIFRLPIGATIAGVLALALVGVNAIQLVQFHQAAEANGGKGFWSNAIYRAADLIAENYPDDFIMTTDWGQRDQFIVLFGSKKPVSFWAPGDNPPAEFKAQLDSGHTLFTLYAEPYALFKKQRQALMSLLQEPSYGNVEWHTIYDRTGQAVILVVKVHPKT